MSHRIEAKTIENGRGERMGGFGFRKKEDVRVI
jgi:hypothetical protein